MVTLLERALGSRCECTTSKGIASLSQAETVQKTVKWRWGFMLSGLLIVAVTKAGRGTGKSPSHVKMSWLYYWIYIECRQIY